MNWGQQLIGRINGRLVHVTIKMRLCPSCERSEYVTLHDYRKIRVTYFDDTPVMHK